MTQEVSKQLMCLKMRGGAEIWLEKEKAENFLNLMTTTDTKFIQIGDEVVNTANVEGLFSAQTMEDVTRRKNGQWKDKYGEWRDRSDRTCRCGNIIPFGKICGVCN